LYYTNKITDMNKITRQWEFNCDCAGMNNNVRVMRINEAGNMLLERTKGLSNGEGGNKGEGKLILINCRQ
jgi:hypothetical protein